MCPIYQGKWVLCRVTDVTLTRDVLDFPAARKTGFLPINVQAILDLTIEKPGFYVPKCLLAEQRIEYRLQLGFANRAFN